MPHCHLKGQYIKIRSILVYCLQVHDEVSSNVILTVATLEEICKWVFKSFNFSTYRSTPTPWPAQELRKKSIHCHQLFPCV